MNIFKIIRFRITEILKSDYTIDEMVAIILHGPKIINSEKLALLRSGSDIKADFVRRALNVALFTTFIGVFLIFATAYKVIIINYRAGEIIILFKETVFTSTGKVIGTFILFSVGFILFSLKRKKQLFYGILETAFALASGYTLIDNVQKLIMKNRLDVYLAFPIMTTVYLIVRGLSNIHEGYIKDKKKNLNKIKE